jgi:hypothetical protein
MNLASRIYRSNVKWLGFVRRQVAFCVLCQTTTVALLAVVVGVPAGTTVGRLVWRGFARNIRVLRCLSSPLGTS